MRLFLSVLLLCTGPLLADEQVFLEGFPDVPLLSGLTEQAEDRVVFDTPSGTVAETVIRAEVPAKQVLNSYAEELVTFGWACVQRPLNLTCTRENDRLVFQNDNPADKHGVIILRLEPVE